jgi:hypothetical protein
MKAALALVERRSDARPECGLEKAKQDAACEAERATRTAEAAGEARLKLASSCSAFKRALAQEEANAT